MCPATDLYWDLKNNASYDQDPVTLAKLSAAAKQNLVTRVLWMCIEKPPPPPPPIPPPTTPAPMVYTSLPWTDAQRLGNSVSFAFAGALGGVVVLGILGGINEALGSVGIEESHYLGGAVGGGGRY